MRSKHYFTLAIIGSGLAVAGLAPLGCGGSSDSGTTSGVGGTTSTTTTHTSSTTAVTTGTGGTGGGSGNHDITDATPLTVDTAPVDATLQDANTSDFYSFSATAGDRLFIAATAPGLASEGKNSDTSITYPTVVLIGPDMNVMSPLTYQAGSFPNFSQDSTLFVQIPATGTYYVSVQDCNALFSMGCPDPTLITNFEYNLAVAHTSKLTQPEVVAATTQDGTTAKADALTFKVPTGGKTGQYGAFVFGGDFPSASSKQVFSFTPPADLLTSAGAQARADFYVQVIGNQGGDLSDSAIKIWATKADGTTIVAEADQANYAVTSSVFSPLDFSFPITAGQQYYLFATNDQASGSPAKDFYFIEGYLNALIDVALPAATLNTTKATAFALTGQGSAKDFFTIDSTLTPVTAGTLTPLNEAWYSFTIPTAVTTYQVQCDAARSGSGLTGFTATLLQADGTTQIATMTESATSDLLVNQTALPSGQAGKAAFLHVTATAQDATNTGNQYRCYVFFG